MRLKPIVAAVGIALATCVSAYAQTADSSTSTENQTADTAASSPSLAIFGLMPINYQNQGGIIQNNPDAVTKFFNHLIISGALNADAGISSRTPSTLSPRTQYSRGTMSAASLTNAFLYADWVGTWLHGHASLMYGNWRGHFQRYNHDNGMVATANGAHFTRPDVTLDEATFTIANFNKMPLFIKGGKFYVPFGDYQPHPLTQTLPQQLAQTQGNALEMGFVLPAGQQGKFTAAAYVFQRAQRPASSRQQHYTNFGGQISYDANTANSYFHVDLGYLYNMIDVDYISTTPVSSMGYIGNFKPVQGLAFDMLGYVGAFDFHFNVVEALARFDMRDVAYKMDGAQPGALDVGTGYNFVAFKHDNRIGLSYQHSWQASQLGIASSTFPGVGGPGAGLPKNRYQISYGINILPQAQIAFQARYDSDYGVSSGGTRLNSVTGLVRLAVGLA